MRKFTAQEIVNAYKKKGYKLVTLPDTVNIFGIRNKDTKADTFDDVIGLVWGDGLNFGVKQYDATTDPGSYYREKPMNVNGSAIIVPMQHKQCYRVGLHTGYEAMQQIAPMEYVRDNNKDKILDFLYKVVGAKKYREIAATNIHHASKTGKSGLNYNWSAGCQVIADIKDWTDFMTIIKSSKNKIFDYTLFEIEDFE